MLKWAKQCRAREWVSENVDPLSVAFSSCVSSVTTWAAESDPRTWTMQSSATLYQEHLSSIKSVACSFDSFPRDVVCDDSCTPGVTSDELDDTEQ